MSEQLVSKYVPGDSDRADEEIHLLDLLTVLAEHKKIVVGTPLLVGALAMAASLLMTPIFVSTAKIMPPQQAQSSGMAAMLGQLGGLAGAAGGLAGIKNPSDTYVGLLQSRTVADGLIKRFDLAAKYGATMEVTRQRLAAHSAVGVGKKDGMISITVRAKDPQFAADLANGYVDELAKLTQSLALTESSQRRVFFEKQLAEARDQLGKAEIAMRSTQEKTGMIQPEAQVQAIIGNAAQLKGLIAAKEVQLSAMATFAAGQNPELLRARQELRGLLSQLDKLEKSRAVGTGGFMVPTAKLPEVGVEYLRSARTVKYYETIFELLAKQFELAKIDEAKESTSIQVLDAAIPAETRLSPNRTVITLAGVVFGAVLGVVLAFTRAAYLRSRRNSAAMQRWTRLGSAIRGR